MTVLRGKCIGWMREGFVFLRRAAAASALLLAASVPSSSPAAAADVTAELIGTFFNPVYVTVAPGEPELLFIVERRGRIQVMRNETTLPQPFLNIQGRVLGPPDAEAGGEQGLLSMAFAPDYAESGLFYVAYTNRDGALEVDEFRRSEASSEQADKSTRRRLIIIPHEGAQNHNGGQLQFGNAGNLFISTGDGGALSPPGEPAPDLTSLLGKILRIVPQPTDGRPYGIPPSNPYVGEPGRDEIFAYGLRNPWRFSLDRGRIFIGDVGHARREEVNVLPIPEAGGVNFGWPEFEGDLEFDSSLPGPDPATFPALTLNHGNGRCAIVGGYVVRDPDLPALAGRYIHGDSCNGQIRSFLPEAPTVDDRPAGLRLERLSSFGKGFNGQLYAAQITGEVSRLEPPL